MTQDQFILLVYFGVICWCLYDWFVAPYYAQKQLAALIDDLNGQIAKLTAERDTAVTALARRDALDRQLAEFTRSHASNPLQHP